MSSPNSRDDWDLGSVGPVAGTGWAPGEEEPVDRPTTSFDLPEAQRLAEPRRLGAGGMGLVDVVVDRRLGREVARKTLLPRWQGHPEAEARLVREARLTALLDHPGIVVVHDAGRDAQGQPFYTMRLVRGATLEDKLAVDGSRAEQMRLISHVLQACQAMAYAHSQGVIHRDLKPANILVGAFGETQVLDWGLARFVDEAEAPWEWAESPAGEGEALTQLGRRLGTPAYMSPEQARGDTVDPRTDVFALGKVLDQVAPGERDPAFDAIVACATAVNREDRYPDAGALAADLQAWLDGRRVAVHDYSTAEVVRRLAWRYRVPLGLSAVFASVLTLVGVVAWERTTQARDDALAAEAQMRKAVADTLADQAEMALMDDDRVLAEQLASRALDNADSTKARGVLASTWSIPRPELTPGVELPACGGVLHPLSVELVACVEPARTRGFDTRRGEVVWEIKGELDSLAGGEVGLVELQDQRYQVTTAGAERVPGLPEGWPDLRLVGMGEGFVVSGERKALAMQQGTDIHDFQPCPEATVEMTSVVVGPRALHGLCSDGSGFDYQVFERELTRWVPDRRFVDASLLIAHEGGYLAGSHQGHVALLSAEYEVQAEGSAELGAVRALVPLRHGLVAVGGERGPARFWWPEQASWWGTIPGRGALVGAAGRLFRVAERMDEVAYTAPVLWRLKTEHGIPTVAVLADGSGDSVMAGPEGIRRVSRSGGVTWHTQTGKRISLDIAADPEGGAVVNAMDGVPALYRVSGDGTLQPDERVCLSRTVGVVDGAVMVGCYGNKVEWLVDDAHTIEKLDQRVVEIQAGASDHVLAVKADGRLYRVYGPGRWVAVPTERYLRGVALGPDGSVLLAERDRIELLGPDDAPLREIEVPGLRISALAISAGGRFAAIGGLEGQVRVIELSTGQERGRLKAHEHRVSDLAFSEDDVLVSVSWDGAWRRFDLQPMLEPRLAIAR